MSRKRRTVRDAVLKGSWATAIAAAPEKLRYPWDSLSRPGRKVLIRDPKRSARIAAAAYAGRHGFAIRMWRTREGHLLVQRVREARK